MTKSAESRAYKRGYYRGRFNMWPAHKPPQPTNEVIARVMTAARELRNEADWMCATLMEGDDFVLRLGPKIDELDRAMAAVTKWLLDEAAVNNAITRTP